MVFFLAGLAIAVLFFMNNSRREEVQMLKSQINNLGEAKNRERTYTPDEAVDFTLAYVCHEKDDSEIQLINNYIRENKESIKGFLDSFKIDLFESGRGIMNREQFVEACKFPSSWLRTAIEVGIESQVCFSDASDILLEEMEKLKQQTA